MTMTHVLRRVLIIGISVVILLGLNTGILEGLGVSVSYSKLVCEMISYLIFIGALYHRRHDKAALRHAIIFIFPLAACGLTGLMTSINAPDGLKGGILFVRWIMSYALFGVALLMIAPNDTETKTIRVIIVGMILIQPVVAVIKLVVIGIGESPWIGTLHQSAGQFGLLLPLIAVSYLLPRFLIRSETVSLLLIIPFIFFSIVYEKRAAIYLLPCWFIMIYAIYAVQVLMHKKIKEMISTSVQKEIYKTTTIVFLCIGCFISIASNSPSLNPLEKVGGPISFKHVLNYTKVYMTREYDNPMNYSEHSDLNSNNDIQIGRFKAIAKLWNFMSQQSAERFFFGYGGGYVNSSPVLGDARSDILFERTGIRSSIPAASNLVVEAGVIGVLLLVVWFGAGTLLLIRQLWNAHSMDSFCDALSLFGFFSVVGFDFFVYSSVLWTTGVMSPLVFAVLGCALGRLRMCPAIGRFSVEKQQNMVCVNGLAKGE